ncbi:MAG: XdhC/CoxI family protein [Chloroflexi bacterium]|nr:XdhC/CoxI family protein [Chloroflexota bacterium]
MARSVLNVYEELKRNLGDETLCAVATVVGGNADVGAKMLVYPDGRTVGDLGGAELGALVAREAQRLMSLERSESIAYGGVDVFVDVFAPKPKLVIFGGVHTAIPLTQFAQTLGFHVTVVDGRGRFATRERFPSADAIIVAWPDEAIAQMKIDSSTYVAILTHDPKFDIPALQALSTMQPRYIGSMGSRETRRQHFAELRAAGVSDEFLARVHGPIGLDLGAHTPEEMALSILGEIIAARYGRSGGFLSAVVTAPVPPHSR